MTYIDPRHKWTAHLDRVAGWQRGETPAPVTVEWDLSNRCVLGCQDCHFAHTHVKGPWATRPRALPMAFEGTGDLADVAVVERTLREMARVGVQGLVWSGGGEPTTHPEWRDAVALAADCHLEQGMYTLGGLLTPDDGAFLAERASWVVVSLDAHTPETYAAEKGVAPARFDAACNGLLSLQGGKAVIGASFLLHGENWDAAPAMLALARSLGATYATFRPAIRTSPAQPGICSEDRAWITDALPTLAALAREHDVEIDPARFVEYRDWAGHGYTACHGITLATTITPDGRVWLCPQRRGVAGSCLGDLRTESFSDLWARHPRTYTVDDGCRAMCRLHLLNTELAAVYAPRAHGAFV